MKHGLALLAAGLVLLAGALLVACPPLALATGAEACLANVAAIEQLGRDCALLGPADLGLGQGAPGTATIFLIGGLAALASGIVALRVSCPPTHARRHGAHRRRP